MSGSSWENIQDVREALPNVWKLSRGPLGSPAGPPGCPVVVGWPFGCPGVVGRPSWMSGNPFRIFGSGQKALPEVRKWSGEPPGCPAVVGRPSRLIWSGRETLPDIREPLQIFL